MRIGLQDAIPGSCPDLLPERGLDAAQRSGFNAAGAADTAHTERSYKAAVEPFGMIAGGTW